MMSTIDEPERTRDKGDVITGAILIFAMIWMCVFSFLSWRKSCQADRKVEAIHRDVQAIVLQGKEN